MSICIDTNLIYLQTRLNLSAEKLQAYQGKTVDEIIKAEAAAGNPLAIELAQEILTNVTLLMEIFQLANPDNRYMILLNMRESQLKEFLPLMEEEDLNEGLFLFDMNQLMNMLKEVPPEQLVKTVFEMFSKEDIKPVFLRVDSELADKSSKK